MAVYGSNEIYGDSYYKDQSALPDDSHIPVDSDYYLVSFSMAVFPEQGIAFSENTGDDCLFVEPGFNGMQIEDENGILRQLAFHDRKGYVTDQATKDGPVNSGQSKIWQDGVDTDGENGTDVEPLVRFGSDEGTFEHYWLRLMILHFYLRTANYENRGEDGYDSAGFPDGLQLDLNVFVDGERSTASRTAVDIPITGDVHTEEHVEGHRIAYEVSANMGDHIIVGRRAEYVVDDRPIGSGVMTEDDYCEELSKVGMWFSRVYPYIDLATGLELSSALQALITLATGPDSRSETAWQFTENITLPSVSMVAGSIMFFGQNINVNQLKVGSYYAEVVEYATKIGDWSLYYAVETTQEGDITTEGNITVVPDGTGKLFDFRVFTETIISTAAIAYYFNNINSHEGDVVLPS